MYRWAAGRYCAVLWVWRHHVALCVWTNGRKEHDRSMFVEHVQVCNWTGWGGSVTPYSLLVGHEVYRGTSILPTRRAWHLALQAVRNQSERYIAVSSLVVKTYFFFRNPVLFAIYTITFSKMFKKSYRTTCRRVLCNQYQPLRGNVCYSNRILG
jgi:hypothetical protein